MALAIIIACVILFAFLLAISICKSAAEDDRKIEASFQNDHDEQEEDEPALPANVENYLQNLYKPK